MISKKKKNILEQEMKMMILKWKIRKRGFRTGIWRMLLKWKKYVSQKKDKRMIFQQYNAWMNLHFTNEKQNKLCNRKKMVRLYNRNTKQDKKNIIVGKQHFQPKMLDSAKCLTREIIRKFVKWKTESNHLKTWKQNIVQ